ncbi:MAG: ROK family glucokinase [Actinobacteria bacterium]|uniref:Glucokinase n=1 Tax=freshwater metagenome TaxID=449393 RepID=A0A6J7CHB5_9ZZZZ|nr:ROK family glucokinase [Actinomycetota bacterium]
MTYSIGVDVGGTKILAGLVDEQGSVVATARRPTPRNDASDVLDVVSDVVRELGQRSDGEVVGVGLGVAGPVDAARSTVFFAPNLGWAQVPVRAILEARVSLPVVVENDGNAAAWGEFRCGAGADVDELTMVTVGTGIGGGIIINGELLRGAHGAAGEIGHMNVVVNGRACGCGRGGCWEQYASGNALVREARALAADRRGEASLLLGLGDGTPEGVQGVHVTQAAQAGDPVAIEAFTVIGTWLGRGLADLCAILDPGTFVIGGGVCEAGDLLLVSARQTLLDKLSGQQQRPAPQVRLATLGNNAGLIGAAELARPNG